MTPLPRFLFVDISFADKLIGFGVEEGRALVLSLATIEVKEVDFDFEAIVKLGFESI